MEQLEAQELAQRKVKAKVEAMERVLLAQRRALGEDAVAKTDEPHIEGVSAAKGEDGWTAQLSLNKLANICKGKPSHLSKLLLEALQEKAAQ